MQDETVIVCARCGAENSNDAAFCRACHHFLSWTEPTPTPPARPRGRKPQPRPVARQPSTPEPDPPAPPEAPVPPEPVRSSTPDPTPPKPRAISTTSVHDIIAAIDQGRKIATSRGRSDLDEHLDQTRKRLAARRIPVVVVGEFKQGKSTLVNALLQSAVCPVDADVVTAMPTMIHYAEQPSVTRYLISEDGNRVEGEPMPLDALHRLVTEEADPGSVERQRTIEVGLPHRMLRSGLALVDTPGVGGLDSGHGHLTLGALSEAEGVLFVTDAAQELTEPELEFLRTSAERCPRIALVMTKVDLYPQWRRMAELNRGHLERAGLTMPIIPVSSFLRLRAAKDPDLNLESGFADLVTFLARDVVAAARDVSARAAAAEVDFVATQLQHQTQAEQAVIAAPEQAAKVVAELSTAQEQAKELAAPTATWQLTLLDGINQMEADVSFDLLHRLKVVVREAEAIIDQGDPKETWAETEVWLRRQVSLVAVANRDLLTERAEALAKKVTEQFELPSASGLVFRRESTSQVFEAMTLPPPATFNLPGTKLAPYLIAARSGYLPVMLGSAATGAVAAMSRPLSADPLRGHRAVRRPRGWARPEDLHRRASAPTEQPTASRQSRGAQVRLSRKSEPLVKKQVGDALRSTRQALRDDFHGRAQLLERSAHEALRAAQQVSAMGSDQQQAPAARPHRSATSTVPGALHGAPGRPGRQR